MKHNEWIREINKAQEPYSRDNFSLESLELTEEEQKIIDNLPESVFETMRELLSNYESPNPEFDFREAAMLKAIAMFLSKQNVDSLEKLYDMGVDFGEESLG